MIIRLSGYEAGDLVFLQMLMPEKMMEGTSCSEEYVDQEVG